MVSGGEEVMEVVHPSVFLTSFELVPSFFEKCNEEFSYGLYEYCDHHGRSNELLQWAIQCEVDASHLGDVFRGNTLSMKLLLFQFYDDVGKQYLTEILVPLIQSIIAEKNLEVEEDKVGRSKSDKDTKTLMKLISSFLQGLIRSTSACPSSLRQTFALMKETAKAKFGSVGEDIMGGVVFSRFILPCLVDPVKYHIFTPKGKDKTLSPKAQRGLVLASKIIQAIANKHAFSARGISDQNAAKIDKFVQDQYPTIEQYINELTERTTIPKVASEGSPVQIKELEERLFAMMNNIAVLPADLEYQRQLDNIKGIMASDLSQWRVSAVSKKFGICSYYRKLEGDTFASFLCKTKLSIEMNSIYGHIKDLRKSFSTLKFVGEVRHLEKVDENYHHWAFVSVPQYPFSLRDAVVCTRTFKTEDNIVMLMYSVTRDDYPPVPKIVRAAVKDTAYVLEKDPDNPNGCILTFIMSADIRATLPGWLLSWSGKSIVTYLKGLQDVTKKIKHASLTEIQEINQ